MLHQRPSFAAMSSFSLGRSVTGEVWAKWLTLLVWALVAFSAVTWVLRWSAVRDVSSVPAVTPQALPEADDTAVARSLGAAPAPVAATPSLASRFQLVGVLTGGPNAGAALLAVDGKPAKPFRVGAVVTDGLVLQSTQGRRVSLGAALDGASVVTLELPLKK